MPLIVEDGTGVPTADSWVSVADAKAYAAKMGYAAYADADDEVLEPALRRAVQYIEAVYGSRWAGQRTDPDPNVQRLSWPRKNVILDDGYAWPDNEIPGNLIAAQVEASIVEYNSSGSLQPTSGAALTKKAVTVGPISVEYAVPEGGGGSSLTWNGWPTYTTVEGLLAPLLDANKEAGNVAFLLRA